MDKSVINLGTVTISRKTSKALMYTSGDGVDHWIPFGQIIEDESTLSERSPVGSIGTLCVTEWFAKESKLIRSKKEDMTNKELKNKFVIDGELTSFEPKEGQYGDYALIKWTHNKQEFSAMATGESVEKLKAIIQAAGGASQTPSVSLAGFLQMRESKKGGWFLNLRVIDAKVPV